MWQQFLSDLQTASVFFPSLFCACKFTVGIKCFGFVLKIKKIVF